MKFEHLRYGLHTAKDASGTARGAAKAAPSHLRGHPGSPKMPPRSTQQVFRDGQRGFGDTSRAVADRFWGPSGRFRPFRKMLKKQLVFSVQERRRFLLGEPVRSRGVRYGAFGGSRKHFWSSMCSSSEIVAKSSNNMAVRSRTPSTSNTSFGSAVGDWLPPRWANGSDLFRMQLQECHENQKHRKI